MFRNLIISTLIKTNLDLHHYNGNNECAYYMEDKYKVEFDMAKEI
jgi:hypothetical protein